MDRISLVKQIKINDVTKDCIVMIGDNAVISSQSKILAVRRDIPIFQGDEWNFADYPIFSAPLPQPASPGQVRMEIDNLSPYIGVGNIRIISVSTSSIFQAGTNRIIQTENRSKHFRQLEEPSRF